MYACLPSLKALWYAEISANNIQHIYLQEYLWRHRRVTEVVVILTIKEWLTQIGKSITSKGKNRFFYTETERGGDGLAISHFKLLYVF
jgi:hypothetical protein